MLHLLEALRIQQGTTGGTNLYDADNAATPTSLGEVNGINGCDNQGGDFTITSENSPVYNGSYSLKFVRAAAAGSTVDAFINILDANVAFPKDYQVKVRAYIESGGTSFNLECPSWAGWESTVTVPVSGASWTEYTLNATSSRGADLKLRIASSSSAPTNATIYIDNISIIEV